MTVIKKGLEVRFPRMHIKKYIYSKSTGCGVSEVIFIILHCKNTTLLRRVFKCITKNA
jgi:hypothetical protein